MVCSRVAPSVAAASSDFTAQLAQHRLQGAHDEGQADEDHRHQHAPGRIGDVDAVLDQQCAEPAIGRVERGKRDAGHRGGQRERQIDQRIQQAACRESGSAPAPRR